MIVSESVSIYFSDFIDGWVEALLVSGSGLPRFVLPLKFSANFFQSFGGVSKRVVPEEIKERAFTITRFLKRRVVVQTTTRPSERSVKSA